MIRKSNFRKIGILYIVFLLLNTIGCNDKENETKLFSKTKNVPKSCKEHFFLPEMQVEEKKEKPATIILEEDFPNIDNFLIEEKAAALRGMRKHLHLNKNNMEDHKKEKDIKIEKYAYQLFDQDYRKHKNYRADISTLKVNRDRILTSDMRIGGILEDSINSQIPGKVIIIVDQDVLSPTMEYVLLPAYTKIICAYQEINVANQTRLPLFCSRAIRPDGVSIMLTGAISADQTGKTGITGMVDNRYLQKYGPVFLMGLVSEWKKKENIVPYFVNRNDNKFEQVLAKIIEQNLNVNPIITIASGTIVQIIPMADIYLRKVEKKPKKESILND